MTASGQVYQLAGRPYGKDSILRDVRASELSIYGMCVFTLGTQVLKTRVEHLRAEMLLGGWGQELIVKLSSFLELPQAT